MGGNNCCGEDNDYETGGFRTYDKLPKGVVDVYNKPAVVALEITDQSNRARDRSYSSNSSANKRKKF